MRHAYQFKINFTGGIVSPGYLYQLLQVVASVGIIQVRFGLRQQLLIDAAARDYKKLVNGLEAAAISYEVNKEDYPNISSSYAASEIFIKDSWLREGVYKDIFDQFDYKPRLKVNIADGRPTFTPLFTGNINWISSVHPHFWYLYIRFPKTNVLYQWKEWIYTNDIVRLSRDLEQAMLDEPDRYMDNHLAEGNVLYEKITAANHYISKPIMENLELPPFKLPYYEGYNNDGNRAWLGIYRRAELFSISFLMDICKICLETNTGELYTTPWKSIIIKGIEEKNRAAWGYVLGKHQINVRHASNELNWQVEDGNEEGLGIKRLVIRHFDKEDTRTFGLSFAVKTQPKSDVFGSVLIRRQFSMVRSVLKPIDKYDILYTKDFNPNSKEFILFRSNVIKEHLPVYLTAICKYFYEQKTSGDLLPGSRQPEHDIPEKEVQEMSEIYQCRHCLSIYDYKLGTLEYNIPAGVLFKDLPEQYQCALCDAPKNDFVKVQRESLGLMPV